MRDEARMGPEANGRCSFKLRSDKTYRCPQQVMEENLCIFHLSKAGHPVVVERRCDKFEEDFERLKASLGNTAVWDFRGFQFPLVSFEGQTYEAEIWFEEAVFTGPCVFGGAVFKQRVNFSLARFHQSAVFNKARFMSAVRFVHAVFGDTEVPDHSSYSAIFYDARFAGHVDFSEAVFLIKGLFLATAFGAGGTFDRTIFFRETSFEDSTFHGKVLFRGGLGEYLRRTTDCFTDLCDDADFRDVTIAEGAEVRFEDVNLDKARFTGTNLDRMIFRNVQWHRQRRRFWRGRQSLAEEFQLPPGWGDGDRDRAIQFGDELLFGKVSESEQPLAKTQKTQSHYAKVAENYSQLVRNYERQREFETADDFYVGEMEARRKTRLARASTRWRRWLRRWVGIDNLYRIFSRYGTSYLVAVAWLVVWVLAFAAAFLVIGIQPTDQQLKERTPVIRYDFFSGAPLELQQLASDYLKAMTIPLAAVVEQPEIYRPVGALGWTLTGVQVSLVALQGCFVVLALKRKFKRG